MKTKRLSHKKVQAAVDEWNKESGLVYRKKGFLLLLNDGNTYWLGQIIEDGETSHFSIGGTDGTLRSCLNRIQFCQP